MRPLTLTRTDTRPPLRPTVIQPLHEGYDDARRAWNLAADLRPAAIVHARSVDDVIATVGLAAEKGLRVAPQGPGHLASALPNLSDAILLKTDLHREVVVDPVARRARVGAGAVWQDVVDAVAPYGLTALAGSSHDVGVMGYTLGGGASWLGRRFGLAANHVHAVEIVTADGRVVRADHENEPDLFWAVRGGGGNFGVVTAIEIDLLPIREVFAGMTIWAGEHAELVLSRWVEWTRTAPDEATTSARLLRLPPLPNVPEPLREVPIVVIDGAVLADDAEATEILRAVREVAPPMMDTWATMPTAGLLQIHMDPPEPVPGIGQGTILEDLDAAGVAAFLGAAGPESGSPLLGAELRQLGGAFGRAPAHGGSRSTLEGAFAVFGVGIPMTPELGARIHAHLDVLLDALAPWETGSQYLNFNERGGSAEGSFAPADYARLRRVRAAWDPEEMFVASHRIEPA